VTCWTKVLLRPLKHLQEDLYQALWWPKSLTLVLPPHLRWVIAASWWHYQLPREQDRLAWTTWPWWFGQVTPQDSLQLREPVSLVSPRVPSDPLSKKCLTAKTEDLDNRSRRSNIRMRGLPEPSTEEDVEASLKALFREILGADMPDSITFDRTHRANRPRPADNTPRDVICCLHNYKHKEKIMLKARSRPLWAITSTLRHQRGRNMGRTIRPEGTQTPRSVPTNSQAGPMDGYLQTPAAAPHYADIRALASQMVTKSDLQVLSDDLHAAIRFEVVALRSEITAQDGRLQNLEETVREATERAGTNTTRAQVFYGLPPTEIADWILGPLEQRPGPHTPRQQRRRMEEPARRPNARRRLDPAEPEE
ncbi:Hypothetical predicted protein, partial [Pelobates cultripes]